MKNTFLPIHITPRNRTEKKNNDHREADAFVIINVFREDNCIKAGLSQLANCALNPVHESRPGRQPVPHIIKGFLSRDL